MQPMKRAKKMEKIFQQIIKNICNQFDFSFVVDKNLALEMAYNNDNGKAKIMIDESSLGAKEFIATLRSHKNLISAKVSRAFNRIAKKETIEFEPIFKVTKNKFYFDFKTAKLVEQHHLDFTNNNLKYGIEIIAKDLPDYLILWHPGTGGDLSIVYKGKLFGIQIYKGTKKEKITAFINQCIEMREDFEFDLENMYEADLN